jgi:hypothetical protein
LRIAGAGIRDELAVAKYLLIDGIAPCAAGSAWQWAILVGSTAGTEDS